MPYLTPGGQRMLEILGTIFSMIGTVIMFLLNVIAVVWGIFVIYVLIFTLMGPGKADSSG